jgi:antitoxin component YwqK of YwqJK toxin-antitoxin module
MLDSSSSPALFRRLANTVAITAAIVGSYSLLGQSGVTAITGNRSFSVNADGSSSLGTLSIQSESDIRFGSSLPNFTIGAGHDILLGRALGGDSDPTLQIALKAPDSLTRAQLTGDWHYYEYQVDESLNFLFSTSSGTATLQSDGSLLLDGSALGSFSIAPGQTVSAQTGNETLTFAANASRDLLLSTSSQSGKPTLRILVRPESGGATAQMAGQWTVGSFGIDLNEDPPDTYYDGDTLTANANGSVSLPDGSATWSANGSGNITFSDGEGSTTLSVNQSRTLLAYTDSPTEQNHEGALVLLAAASPDIAALAGDWTLLTFSFIEAPDINIVETYHPDGETLASRERYVNGHPDGSPAREQWDENGKLVQSEYYTEGALTYRMESGYSGDLLVYLTETSYDGDTKTSEETTSYHPDGITISEHILDTLTEEGRTIIHSVFAENGTQTSLNQSLDAKPHGLQKDWNAAGQPLALDSFEHGTLLTRQTWGYHTNGQTSFQTFTDYTSGQAFRTTTEWRPDGTRRQVSRRAVTPNGATGIHGMQERYDEGGHLVEEDPWLFAKRHGTFRQWFPGGSPFVLQRQIEYVEGKMHGNLSEWIEDGTLILSQEYHQDLKHGDSYEFDPATEYSQGWTHTNRGVWEYDELRRFETWSRDASGTLRVHEIKSSEATHIYLADPDFHLRETFDDQGRKELYRESRKGEYHGPYRIWHDGVLVSEYAYKQGLQHGLNRDYYGDGTPRSDVYYENGFRHGPFKSWRENGTPSSEGTNANGHIHGTYKSWDDNGELTTSTYDHGILHGPYQSPSETGQYRNDLPHGEWRSYNSDGSLSNLANYTDGVLHGISEGYSDGSLYTRSRYSNGLLHGLQETFNSSGKSSDTTYENGVEVGPQNYYHANGRTSSTINMDAGLRHGSYKAYDAGGRLIGSGNYNHGVQTGIWTRYTYDGDGNRDSDTTNYGSPNPTAIVKGLRGSVTYDGKPIPGVSLRLGEDGPSASTNAAGKYFLELRDYSGTSELTLTRSGFHQKTTTASLPGDYTYSNQNFTLTPYSAPELALGEPSMLGTYFIRGINFPVYYTEMQVPSDEHNRLEVFWLKNDDEMSLGYNDLKINPGDPNHVDSNGYAGSLIARAAPGIQTGPIPLPTYNVVDNPAWADRFGGWETYYQGYADKPGEYRLASKWPARPFSLGIDRNTIGEFYWPIWSQLPVIGDDLGLFDVQFTAKATARTNGTGDVKFDGGGEVRAAKKTLRIEADGEGTLSWEPQLKITKASVLLRATLSAKEDIGALSIFPVLEELQSNLLFGGHLTRLNQLAKIEIELGGGVGARFPIDTTRGRLEIMPTEAELNLRTLGKVEVKRFPAEIELAHESRGFALFSLQGEQPWPTFKSFTLTGKSTAQFRVFDFIKRLDPIEHEIALPATNPSSLDLTNPTPFSTELDLVNPTFLDLATPYSQFQGDIVSLFAESHKTLAEEDDSTLLVSNIYPHANLAIAEQNGARALAYIHYDPARPEGQSTRLYYAIDTGDGFSSPAPVHTQARADFNPQLAFLANGNLLAVWETSQLDQIATVIEDRIQGLEIAYSLYNANTRAWSTPTLLTNNNHFDYNPTLAASENTALLLWQSNPQNLLLPTAQAPGEIKTAIFSGSTFGTVIDFPHTILPSEKGSLAYDSSGTVFAWIQDLDGDPATVDDSELYWSQHDGTSWLAPERITNNNTSDSAPQVFCLHEGQFEIAWVNGNNIVRLADPASKTYEIIRESDSAAPAQFDLACAPDGKIAALWSSVADTQSDLRFALYDPINRTWSEEIALTQTENFEASPAFTFDADGQLLAAYLSEHTDSEQRDLHIIEKALTKDLTISSLLIEPVPESLGQFTLTAATANLGSLSSGSTTLVLYLGDPDNGGTQLATQAVNLAGGETADIEFQTTINEADTLFARIDPANTIEESDETNNTASTTQNPPALAAEHFALDRPNSSESSFTLVGTISNNGNNDLTNIPATITSGEQTIYQTTIASLAAGESVNVSANLPPSETSTQSFTLNVDPDNIFGEPDRSDNDYTLLVTLSQLKDSDFDGMANDWEELYFGTLDRDGNSDFDADGLSDRFEFLTQNNPSDPSSRFPFTIEPHASDSDKVVIRFPTIAGNIYRIQRSSDFESWENDSFHLGTGEMVSVVAEAGSNSSEIAAFRVLVSQQ